MDRQRKREILINRKRQIETDTKPEAMEERDSYRETNREREKTKIQKIQTNRQSLR